MWPYSKKPEQSRTGLLMHQRMGAYVTTNQTAELLTLTTNKVLGDEGLLEMPFRQIAAQYLGSIAARNEAIAAAESVVAGGPNSNGIPVSPLADLMYQSKMCDVVGKYQHPELFMSEYPEGLPYEMAEEVARRTIGMVDVHLDEAYNDLLGSVK